MPYEKKEKKTQSHLDIAGALGADGGILGEDVQPAARIALAAGVCVFILVWI